MTPQTYATTIIVNEIVYKRLTERARGAGQSIKLHAQQLFDAAYAARCGVDTGDAALERAVKGGPIQPTAALAAFQPPVHSDRVNPENVVMSLTRERDALARSLAAAGQTIEAWKVEGSEWGVRAATAARQMEIITATLAEQEAENARLRAELAARDDTKPAETTIEPAPVVPEDNSLELAGCTIRMIVALNASGLPATKIARETDTSLENVRRVLAERRRA